jgi:hypothetical protein
MKIRKALSIRQPWAWLIIHGGKDIENRFWNTKMRGPILIHASSTMTDMDYESARHAAAVIRPDLAFPEPEELEKGGIIGEVTIATVVAHPVSRWFDGPYGFVLKDPKPLPFHRCPGQLKFFDVVYE